MKSNSVLEEKLRQMAVALELLGENRFRINALARAARVIDSLDEEVEMLVGRDPESAVARLTAIPGIGKGLAAKILEFVASGKIEEHEDLVSRIPAGLFDLLDVPGLGPKAVKMIWERLGIETIEELRAGLDSPDFAALPRMGKKSIENIKKALDFRAQSAGRIPIGKALPIALDFVDFLEKQPGAQRVEYAGSLRRGRETIGDIDLLVSCADPLAMRKAFVEHPSVTQVLAAGESKSSVRIAAGGHALQVDLRIVENRQFGAAWLYFTGSKEHNVALRERAGKRGMRLNEYGLFEDSAKDAREDTERLVAEAEEFDIYRALGLEMIPPELREERWPLEELPDKLVERSLLRADLHTHTLASDGKLSIEAMARHARSLGFHTLAVTDHSRSSVISNGLSIDRLRTQIEAVRAADAEIDGIRILAGSEVDILPDGRLDYPDEILEDLDIVVASPHVSLRQSSEDATKRLLAAILHPAVKILGHPTGRMISQREGLSPDMDRLFEAAADTGTALEINAHWMRLDLRDRHVARAVAKGCLLAINSDAHTIEHFDFLEFGVLTARRGGLPASSCINTWPAGKLYEWLSR